jgi:hypothetical protein
VRLPLVSPDGGEADVEAEVDVEGVGVVVGVDVFELLHAARLPAQASDAALTARVRASRIVVSPIVCCDGSG